MSDIDAAIGAEAGAQHSAGRGRRVTPRTGEKPQKLCSPGSREAA